MKRFIVGYCMECKKEIFDNEEYLKESGYGLVHKKCSKKYDEEESVEGI